MKYGPRQRWPEGKQAEHTDTGASGHGSLTLAVQATPPALLPGHRHVTTGFVPQCSLSQGIAVLHTHTPLLWMPIGSSRRGYFRSVKPARRWENWIRFVRMALCNSLGRACRLWHCLTDCFSSISVAERISQYVFVIDLLATVFPKCWPVAISAFEVGV